MKLNQKIGPKTLFLLTINAIIGTGIFFLPALGALYAGPASILSWVIMSVVAIFISLYFAELISMFPKSGGVYEYTKNAFGEFPSFIFGWIAWIVANITISMLVIGSLLYINPNGGAAFNIAFSLFFIVLFNAISYRGIGISSKMLMFFGAMTIIAMLAIIIPGFAHANIGNFSPLFVFPPISVMLATYFIAESFFGWEIAGYLSEEVKNAKKVVPRVLVLSTVAIAALSIALVFAALSTTGWDTFAVQQAPLSFLAGKLFGSNALPLFAAIIFIPLIGTAASWIISSPRLLYAMSRDGVLVPSFKDLHDKHKTPHKAIIFQTIVSSLITIVALGDFYLVLSLLVPLAVIMYSGVMLSVVRLRIKKPHLKRSFSAPLPKAGPIAITGFLMFLLYLWLTQVNNAASILAMGIVLIFLGVPLYILIKLQTDEKFTEKFFNAISPLWCKMFPIWYGKKEMEKVISRLKIGKDSVVLDFGCGSGITTVGIARRAGKGTVVGVDISEKQLERAVSKIKKAHMGNVVLIKERNLKFRKGTFDAVVGVDVLGYLSNPRASLKKIFFSLKRGGRFSFLYFGKSFGTPAPYRLASEEQIRKLFSGLGLDVHVSREKKKFAEYWHIWGRKR